MKAVLSVGKDLQEDARQRQQNEDASITQYEPAETREMTHSVIFPTIEKAMVTRLTPRSAGNSRNGLAICNQKV
jgi:hypothetical protein